MRILIIGSGGREHALCLMLLQSPLVTKIYCIPGNAGISEIAESHDLSLNKLNELVNFAKTHRIDLTIVGPEEPLARGIVDRFIRAKLSIFGPTREAAQIESSKIFCKELLAKNSLPTASFRVADSIKSARGYLRRLGFPRVIKADGLCQGKGVKIVTTMKEADTWLNILMIERRFGAAGERVVIEEALTGKECSVFVISNGYRFWLLPYVRDYKPLHNADKGPNTGGMGAWASYPIFPRHRVSCSGIHDLYLRLFSALDHEDIEYRGVLYLGLMFCPDGPQILECNARFGDPETQVILPLMKGDLFPILAGSCYGPLEDKYNHSFNLARPRTKNQSAVCVVMTSQGYPEDPLLEQPITGLRRKQPDDTFIFHAGTKREGEIIVSTRGRVLGVTGLGDNRREAASRAYEAVRQISFPGAHYRTDIGR